MKTYLTKNGLLVVREDASFFTSNSGEFRRLATDDEVEYLVQFLDQIEVKSDPVMRESGRKQFLTPLLTMEVPLWYYLWTTSVDDYTHYKPGTCNNGGDYSYHTSKHFFARNTNGRWEIRVFETHSTSSEFPYDELAGSFQSNLDTVELIGINEGEFASANEPLNSWLFRTNNGGEDGSIVIDQLLSSCGAAQAILEPNYRIPEMDSDEDEEVISPDENEIERRLSILAEIGYSPMPDVPVALG